ncbi:MAG: TonB family protein [Pseudomonadota bacterium]
MRSEFLNPSGRRFWTSRGAAMVAILLLHGVVVTIVMLARTAPAQEPTAEPMQVTLMTEQQRPESAPVPKIALEPVQLPTPVIPIVNFDVSEPPPVTITVANVPEAPRAPADDANAPIMATTVEYVRAPVVAYPIAAKRAHASGTVQVRALVEADGHVRDARVHHSSGHELLDRAACDSVRGALFKPYMLNGSARSALVIVPVDFQLTIRTASR